MEIARTAKEGRKEVMEIKNCDVPDKESAQDETPESESKEENDNGN